MICDTNDTVAYIKRLAQDLAGCETGCAVISMLLEMAVPANFDGFEYLKAAVVIQQEEPTRDLVNQIYRMLAERYGVSEEIVSSSIRSAISTAWKRAEREVWYLYLPTVPRERDTAPTNAEVIAGLARIAELWKGCADAYLRQRSKEVVCCERRELFSSDAFRTVP